MFVALTIATAASLAPPYLAGRAIDDGIREKSITALVVITALFLLAAVVNWGASYAQTYLVNWVGQRALQDLRERLFAHLQRLSVGFYSRNRAGVVISRITNDVQALDQLVTDGVVTLFSASLTLVGTAAILLFLDAELALVTFAVFPVLIVASVIFRLASANAYRLTREKIALVTAYLQETLSGVRVVRAFGQEPRHKSRFSELNDDNRAANMRRSTSTPPTSRRSSCCRPWPPRRSCSTAATRCSTTRSPSACWRRSSSTCRPSSTRSSSSPSSTPPTRRAWPRWTRSSTCSTRSPT